MIWLKTWFLESTRKEITFQVYHPVSFIGSLNWVEMATFNQVHVLRCTYMSEKTGSSVKDFVVSGMMGSISSLHSHILCRWIWRWKVIGSMCAERNYIYVKWRNVWSSHFDWSQLSWPFPVVWWEERARIYIIFLPFLFPLLIPRNNL